MNGKTLARIEQVASSLGDREVVERFRTALLFLQMHLIIKRDIPNGKDFLFSGPANRLQDALKTVVSIEHKSSPSLQLDYARIEEYYLLRIVGGAEHQEVIEKYFD